VLVAPVATLPLHRARDVLDLRPHGGARVRRSEPWRMSGSMWGAGEDLANTFDAYIGHIFGRIGSQQKVSNELLYG